MRKIVSFFILILLSQSAISQSFKTQVKEAKVYLNNAQVFSEANVKIPAGRSTIYLTEVGAGIDENNIQIETNGNFTLLNVRYLPDYGNSGKSINQDSINFYQSEIAQKKMQVSIIDSLQKILLLNSSIKGANNNLNKAELEDMLGYFNQKLTDYAKTKSKLFEEIKNLQNRLIPLQKDDNFSQSNQLVLSKIELVIESNIAQNALIKLNYMVFQAGWEPVYDLRVKDISGPVQIVSKANVWQNSGISWEDVKLKLSTSNPQFSGQRPNLYPQFLSFFVPHPPRPVYDQEIMMDAAGNDGKVMRLSAKSPEVKQVESTFATEYEIKELYTINSSRRPSSVAINDINLNAEYSYLAIPKIQSEVLLTATVRDFAQHRLIPGQANVFFDNAFVNKTFLDGINVNDSLQIGLGADKRIIVKREAKRDYKNRRIIGSSIREDFAYQIVIKNTKSQKIDIIIEDQVPVSQDSSIEIEIKDLNGAVKDDEGKLIWNLHLGPMESKTLNVSYTVKYPKNKLIYNL